MKNELFVISALSLAIAGVNNVYAESPSGQSPQDCVVEGGQGDSLQEWGMWCGVGSFLAALSEQEPTAAGPGDGPEVDLNVNPPGRGDAEEFDPVANALESDDPVIPPVPVPEPVAPHIVLPSSDSGQYVGYFASQDFSYDDESEDEGYGEASNHQTGGFNLSLEDGGVDDGYGEPVRLLDELPRAPDTVAYGRSDHQGNPIDNDSFTSEDDFYTHDEDGGRSQDTNTYLTDVTEQSGSFNARRQSHNHGGESPYDDINNAINGNEVRVYQESDSEDENDNDPRILRAVESVEILKNYWAGGFDRFDETVSQNRNNGAFVTGELTPLDDILSMTAGDVNAVYTGNSHQWNQSVRLNVDFGERSFTGEFGDIDMYRKGSAGISEDTDMSFSATGVIEGVNLISESVSADEGFVQGSLFGEGGRIIGGGYDVTKGTDRVVDVFTAVEGENNRVDSDSINPK